MACASFEASAPGKLMLLGEHAVVYGHLALVCAVDTRLRVTLQPITGRAIELQTELGSYCTDLERLCVEPPFTFVLAAIIRFREQLPSGFKLTISSDFSDTVGLGSSSAVTVATCAVLRAWCQQLGGLDALFSDALSVVRQVQGAASGADVAASVYGGVIAYRATPLTVRPLAAELPLVIVHSGRKEPTTAVIDRVRRDRECHPAIYERLFELISECSVAAEAAILDQDWPTLGRMFDINHGLMESLGVCNASLAAIVHALRRQDRVYGAKISGAGLGDCVVGVGTIDGAQFDYSMLPLAVDRRGVWGGDT